jgi:peptidoglycan/LPS O-acetylase OafA/YrhL
MLIGVSNDVEMAPTANISMSIAPSPRRAGHDLAAPKRFIAVAGLGFLLLFSFINNYEKTASAHGASGWLTGSFALPLTIILLAAFAVCTRRALMRVATASPAEKTVGVQSFDPLLTLRAFACVMVLVGHGMGFAFLAPVLKPLVATKNLIWLLTSSPEAGVWIFFTLSGYLIGKGFYTGRYMPTPASVAHFYRNRILRIVPLYWTILTVFSLIAIPSIFAPHNLSAFINMLFFNVDGRLPYMPIGALWSISTEMQFYMAAPLIFILIQPFAKYPIGAVMIACGLTACGIAWRFHAVTSGGLEAWSRDAYFPLFANLDLFVIGMVTSHQVLRRRATGSPFRTGLAFGAATIALLYVTDTYLRGYGVLVPSPAITMIFAVASPTLTAALTGVAIYCFETAPKYVAGSRFYKVWHPTETVGILTYGAYSLHEPFFLLVKNHAPAPPTILLSLLACLGMILIVFMLAYFSYRLVERPFERLKGY